MTNLALLVVHVRSTNRAFWRNPAAAFFTLALPVMFLVLFSVLFGTKPTEVNGRSVSSATFTLAGIITFAVIAACYTNLAIGVTFSREGGFLKRLRGTPLPRTIAGGQRSSPHSGWTSGSAGFASTTAVVLLDLRGHLGHLAQ